tara:strand:- start:139 stop:603 length:465 start_codon:yes stop_codon:yes gene_type:complete
MSKKKNPAPILACVISGQSRKTSHNYLASKAKRLGVSSEWLLNNYVSKYVCSQLRAGRSLSDLQTTDKSISDEQLKELVQKNSKSRVTDFWFDGGVYHTAKPTPKKREEKTVSIDEVMAKATDSYVEKKAKAAPEPVVEPATFDEALAELQEVN